METEAKIKTPGRQHLKCDMCDREFATHSSNRLSCEACVPKCRERHYFNKSTPDMGTVKAAPGVVVQVPA